MKHVRKRYTGLIVAALSLTVPSLATAAVIGAQDNSFIYYEMNPGGGGNLPSSPLFSHNYDYINSQWSDQYRYEKNGIGSGYLWASVNFNDRTLKGYIEQNAPSSGYGAGGYIKIAVADRIYVSGLNSSPVTGTVNMSVDGNTQVNNNVNQVGYSGVYANINTSYNGRAQDSGVACAGTNMAPPNWSPDCSSTRGDFDINTSAFFSVSSFQPYFDVIWQLTIYNSTHYGSATADISHTAHINIVLPDGYTYTSESGFLSTEPVTNVPEPASLALFGAGLFGLAAIRRGRTRNRTAVAA
ncbi:PEP-CTERM sorting domain-containing protein [Belnapia moabensis]|uniref:PEP-CTERM sorting domain-containing protein n=1 Tax=Belnapia moabensis TaxID=365533 RepID=UPI000A0206E4|nr:PEP-CTERM sorting domain-containing protein [Belnapia moabensis]